MFQDRTIRRVGIGVLVLLTLFLLAKTLGEFKAYRYIGSDPALRGTITVSGEAERPVKPDIARFNFGVTEDHASVQTAQDRSAKKVNEIMAYLKDQGIEEKDIKTSGYNIYPRYDYKTQAAYWPNPTEDRRLAGYTVSQTIEVKLRDVASAGTVLGGIGEHGATDISGLSFEVDNQEKIVEEIKGEAIADAREKAEKLAKDLGVKLSRVVNYSEGGYYPMYARLEAANQAYDTKGSAGGVTPPAIPGGENLIKTTVSITYEIK